MKTILCRLGCLLSFAFVVIFATPAYADPSYTIVDLGTMYDSGNYNRRNISISDNGLVAGTSESGNVFLYSNGIKTDLGTSQGKPTFVMGINNSGQVVGYDSSYNAFVYSNGTMITLPPVAGSYSWAASINNSGQIVGYSSGENHAHVAVLYDANGGKIDLGPLGGAYGITAGINNNGQIAGYNLISGCCNHAVLYSNGIATDLGTLVGGGSIANAINDHGEVVGRASFPVTLAFLYSQGNMINLGSLGGGSSQALGINNSGQIVGGSHMADNVSYHAFLYGNGTMRDLNDLLPTDSGWLLEQAFAINNSGQIVGYGIYKGDRRRGFLLNPQSAVNVIFSGSNLSLTEGGISGAYTVTLSSLPSADVVMTVSPDNQLAALPLQLIFTTANWNVPQTVMVSASLDGIAEGSHSGLVRHTVASADARYNGLSVSPVTVAIADAVIPTANVPVASGTVLTQSDLRMSGTASPGATITLYVANLSTGETRAVSAVAGADGIWSLTLNGLTDGTYELQPEAGGITGGKVTVAVDSRAPVSTLSVTSNNGPAANGWFTGPVNLGMSATDSAGGSGVERSEHTLDGGAWTVFPGAGLTLNADGNHTVCYRSVDKVGNVEAARCVPIPIDATAPLVNPIFDSASNTLALNAQDAVSGIASIEISRDGGQTWTAHSGPVGFTRDGTYVVQYRVRDNAGNLATGQATVTVVTVPNIAAPADQTAVEAASQSFSLGSFSDLTADNPWNVDIGWGDGSAHSLFTLNAPGALGSLPHTYLDSGTYVVTIKVTDQVGNTGSKSFRIAVANVAPTATFTATGGPLNEGDFATLAFSNPADPSPVDTQAGFRYAFDCGDGNGFGAAGTASTVMCRALDNPDQTIRGRVIDKDGGATDYSATVAINNVAPVLGAIAGPASPVVRDTPATISADFTDAGMRDTHAVMVDWDDGTVSTGTVTEANGSGSVSTEHSYARPGRYAVTLTLTDKDGASAVGTYIIQVRGGPPAR